VELKTLPCKTENVEKPQEIQPDFMKEAKA
jgi:hypothetical protein